MRNDKERQEFINDAANWHRAGEMIMGKVRLMSLEYHDRMWYRLDAYTTYEGLPLPPKWRDLRYYRIDKKSGALMDINKTAIRDEIKEIDKEERKKK